MARINKRDNTGLLIFGYFVFAVALSFATVWRDTHYEPTPAEVAKHKAAQREAADKIMECHNVGDDVYECTLIEDALYYSAGRGILANELKLANNLDLVRYRNMHYDGDSTVLALGSLDFTDRGDRSVMALVQGEHRGYIVEDNDGCDFAIDAGTILLATR